MQHRGLYLRLILTTLSWGGAFVAGRVLAQAVPPFTAAFWRFFLASLCLVLWPGMKIPLPSRSLWGWLLALGLSGIFIYNAFFFWGLQTVTASRAALIIALNPSAIAIGAALFSQEPLSRNRIIGMLIALCGAVIVITGGQLNTLIAGGVGQGELVLLGCVLAWTAYTLLGRRVMQEISPRLATTYACCIGTLLLAPPAIAEGLWVAPGLSWVAIAYLGLIATAIAFNWYSTGVQTLGAARTGVFINCVPVSAVVLGILILREPLTLSLLMGGALVGAGVWFTNQPVRPVSSVV